MSKMLQPRVVLTSSFGLHHFVGCECPFPYAQILLDTTPNELARPAPLCAGERMARQQIWIALLARSRREPLAFVLFSGGISHAGSYCGLLLGVERAPLGQILWSMGKFPLLCQIGASVPLLPSLLAESLLAPALAWVSPLARALLGICPAARTLVC